MQNKQSLLLRNQISKNWIVKRLDEISTVTMGQSPPSSSYNDAGQGVPFFQGKPSYIDNLGVASPYQYTTEPTKIVQAGTALMTVRAPVGEIFSTPQDVCIGRGLSGIKANEDVSQSFLNYNLQYATDQFHSLSQGTTFSAINSDDLRGIKVVLPPQSTQQKIAEILSSIDEAIQESDQIIQNTEILKQGFMNELLTKGIGHKKFKQTEIGTIPEEWKISKLGNMAKFTNGKAHEQFISENGRYIVVNSKFISTNGKVIKRSDKNISPLSVGDITMVMSDVPKGKAFAKCFLIDTSEKYTLNQRICSITPTEMNSKFLFYVLNRNKYFLNFDNGVGQTNLRKEEVLNCPIQVPSEKEQLEIVELLEKVDSKLHYEYNYKNSLSILKKGLMHDIFSQKVQIN